jgi:hypothetical protein
LDVPTRRKKKVPEGFEVSFLELAGKPYKRRFKSEDELVDYLKMTRTSEAPVSFKHEDGTVVDRATLERIHRRFFGEEPQPLSKVPLVQLTG